MPVHQSEAGIWKHCSAATVLKEVPNFKNSELVSSCPSFTSSQKTRHTKSLLPAISQPAPELLPCLRDLRWRCVQLFFRCDCVKGSLHGGRTCGLAWLHVSW